MAENNQNVLLHIESGIAHVTLNRAEVHNAFDEDVIARLSAIWADIAAREDIIAVILRGAGKSFSAGGDLNWMKRAASYSEDENYQDGLRLARMLNGLANLPQVTIAMVQGAAMGGGFGLVACCDIVIAGPDSSFALSEVKLGLIPATIGPHVIRAIGPRHARRYFQTGERFGQSRAHEIGLVHECADSTDAMEDILVSILKSIRTNGPQAMRAAKKLASDIAGRSIDDDLLKDTASRIAQTRAGDEAKEGLSAFLEKRKARWIA